MEVSWIGGPLLVPEDMGSIPNHNNHFFSTRKKVLIYLLKLWKLSCCLLFINKNNSRSLKVTHLSLRMTFAELPIGKFSSYTLVSLWSGISSTVRKERLMIITANSEQKTPKIENLFQLDLSNHLPELCRVFFFFLFFNFLTGEVIMYSWGLT